MNTIEEYFDRKDHKNSIDTKLNNDEIEYLVRKGFKVSFIGHYFKVEK